MSYILDALRKAEMERELSRVPGIASPQQFAHAAGRFPARVWLIAAAALSAGVALTWLWFSNNGPTLAQPAVPAVAPPQARKPAPQRVVPAVLPTRQQPETAAVGEEVLSSEDDALSSEDEALTVAEEAVPAGAAEAIETQPQIAAAESQPVAAQQPAVAAPVDPVVAMIAAEAARGWPDEHAAPPAPREIAPARTESAPVDQSLPPLLKTLPYRFQSTVPDIAINAQAYADEAEDRFVIINMKKYREGQHTAEGIAVEGIGKDYLILNYRGQVFRLQR